MFSLKHINYYLLNLFSLVALNSFITNFNLKLYFIFLTIFLLDFLFNQKVKLFVQ